jgi:phosphoheptose isomerase/phosphoglycolate phosphatase-like HAD superfamily hydrolase
MWIKQIESHIDVYAAEVASCMQKTDWKALAKIVEVLLDVKKRNCRIFTAGNGGSHATASHMANDFIKGCRAHNRVAFDIECLGDSVAVLTCLANDFSYDDVFSLQLETKGHRGDAFVYFSGSGNSPNLIKAAEIAREKGITTIGFLGRDGGLLKDLSDLHIIAPSEIMEQIEDLHMLYEHNMVNAIRSTLEDQWGMEVVKYPKKRFHCALFDFDGTLSLIRTGWQEIMIPYFVEILLQTPKAENVEAIENIVTDFVDVLTGKQTIFQCIRLNEEVIKRGGKETNPMVYKTEYLRRLNNHIQDRKKALRDGFDRQEYLVPGCLRLLELLKENGCSLYLASGTDQSDVTEEAKLLGLDAYFGNHIYGARDDQITVCSKEEVLKSIINENKLNGTEILSFGDGFVEIELVSNLGGYSVGVATDEYRLKGINQRKRKRLLEAGASLIIPDFCEAEQLTEFLLNWSV